MLKIKLTKKNIEELVAPDLSGKQKLYWVDGLNGLAVLVSGVSNTKSYIVQKSVHGKTKRIHLGTVEEFEKAKITFDEIFSKAGKLILEMRDGIDHKAQAKAKLKTEAEEKANAITLRSALELYESHRVNISERTRYGYRYTIERFFSQWLDTPLRDIKPTDIEERYHQIKKEVSNGENGGKRKDSKSTIFSSEAGAPTANNCLRALRALWLFAKGRNPEIPVWPKQLFTNNWYKVYPRERHLQACDLKKFYEAVIQVGQTNRTFRDFVLLALFTGIRKNDICALTWDRVDLTSKLIRISAKETKGRKHLEIPISDFVFDILSNHKAVGIEGKFVFPARSKSGHFEEPKKGFKVIEQLCGVLMNPHALRHSFTTMSEQCPISGYSRKMLLGHSLGGDVTGGYVHVSIDSLREATQLVTNKLKEHCGINNLIEQRLRVVS